MAEDLTKLADPKSKAAALAKTGGRRARPTATYSVRQQLTRAGRTYSQGESIALGPGEAGPLLRAKAIETS